MAEPISIAAAVGWGMKAAGWVVSPILSAVLRDAYATLKIDASCSLNLLDLKILRLQLLLSHGESELFHRRKLLDPLMEQMKSALYEAEELLDAVEYHCAEKGMLKLADDKSDIVHKFQKLILPKPHAKSKGQPPAIPKKKLKKTLEKIESLVNEADAIVEQLSLLQGSSDNMPNANRTTGRALSKIIGRDVECDLVVAMLHEPEANCESFSVVGIHGIAGSGKTTLAQAVYAHERLSNHFDTCIWIHVTHEFDPDSICKEMIHALSQEVRPGQSFEDTLMEKLHGKRYLLVLDDLWHRSGDTKYWEKLQQILPPRTAGKKGSKILTTSRFSDAALALGAPKQNCLAISDLDEDRYRELFLHYALGEACSDDSELALLEHLGSQIAKKLRRSPLLARTVGMQLRIRRTVDFWRRTATRELLDDIDIMGSLWWSYQLLQDSCRRCFAFCTVFPRRHRLYREQIIRPWVAAGLIRGNKTQDDLESIGSDHFDELISSGFLQQGVHGEDYYLVHDLLYELASQVSENEYFRVEDSWKGEIPKETRHLYVNSEDLEMLERLSSLQNLRTLIVDNPRADLETMLTKHPKLRILVVPFDGLLQRVPDSICELKYLRYLAFTGGSNSHYSLPRKLAQLYQLQVLEIGSQSVDFISGKEKILFRGLRHVVSLNGSVAVPNLGSCPALQTLSHFVVKDEEGLQIKELEGLNNLRGTLRISGLENIKSREEAVRANLSQKINVSNLFLEWEGPDMGQQSEFQFEILNSLCPPLYIERLHITSYVGSTFPQWFTSLKYLRHISFRFCVQKSGPELCSLVNLESFVIFWCSWNALPSSIHSLRNLKTLRIMYCPFIQDLPVLPTSLEWLTISGCSDLFLKSCETVGHQNYQNIAHIPSKSIRGARPRLPPFIPAPRYRCFTSDAEDGNSGTWGTSPAYQRGTLVVRPFEGPTPGSGRESTPGTGFGDAPLNAPTPTAQPMTPIPASYQPQTPGGPMTPGGMDIMSPAIGDGGDNNRLFPDVMVNVSREDGSTNGVVKEVLSDGSCRVALGSSGSGDEVAALPGEPEIIRPKKNDRLKIMKGARCVESQMTPGGMDIMSPAIGDGGDNNRLFPDVMVNVSREDGSTNGVVKEVLSDGSCRVALGSSGSGDEVAALPGELEIIRPKKNDRLKIMKGSMRGVTGELIGVAGSDGIVRVEGSLEVQIVDMASLGKLAT